jgi:hypothetical protein
MAATSGNFTGCGGTLVMFNAGERSVASDSMIS